MKVPPKYRKELGHHMATETSLPFRTNITGFLIRCTFRGDDCSNMTYWMNFTHPAYGNCFTFNTNGTSGGVRQVTVTGSANGLVLEMFLDQANYMYNKLSKKAGARITIHDPYFLPMPEAYGMDLAPNTASSIAVQLNQIHRQPDPYISHCVDSWADTAIQVPESTNYSLALCQRMCHQKAIAEACNCYWPSLSLPSFGEFSTSFSTYNKTPCSIKLVDNPERDCYADVMADFDDEIRKCPCGTECDERQFLSRVSTSTWPSGQYWRDLGLEFFDPSDFQGKEDEIKQTIQEDFTRAEIYYQTMNVVTLRQDPKYTLQSLFGALGGGLSLYLGVAVVMLFEVIELLIDLALAFICGSDDGKV